MEKESYSIDDILSDLKKHREKELGITSADSDDKKKDSNDNLNQTLDEKIDTKVENIDESVKADEPELTFDDSVTDVAEPEEEPVADDFTIEAVDENGVVSEPDEPVENETELKIEKSLAEINGPVDFVDLMAMSLVEEETEQQPLDQIEEETAPVRRRPNSEKIAKRKKKLKFLRFVIIILLIAVIGVGVYAYLEIKSWAELISNDDAPPSDYISTEWTGMDDLTENFPEIIETEASHLSSLQDMIKTWYYNGAPCSSSHVLNVLLIGEDTRGDEILEEDTRADAAIIASVNTDTKTITLTSVLRDAYAYWENEPGNPETGEFGKINAAMATGIDCYINCVEKLYKIDIDNYAIVNFDNFEDIIDALGGVELEITAAEIREINNHPDTYGWVTIDQTFDGDSGYMSLDGEQALAYCRIRHLDSDNRRADRQKYCLSQLFDQAAGASASKQLSVVKALIPYLHTGFKSDQVLSMANYAVSQNWLGYEMQSITVPNARILESGAGGTYYGAWCWKADYPQDANFLQTILYGKSSVTLARVRVDILNCNEYGFYDESYISTYATITNPNYGVATTYELTTEEEYEEAESTSSLY